MLHMMIVVGRTRGRAYELHLMAGFSRTSRFLFKAKKVAMMTQPPTTPALPRLPRDVVPADNRDDPEIILNTTTV